MAPCRVLVVDDQDEIRAMLLEFLAGAGFRAEAAADAASARRAAARERFDVAVIEAMLRDEPGLDLARELAAEGVAVVMMTGHFAVLAQLRALGVPTLGKPFRLAEFLGAILAARSAHAVGSAVLGA
jgi:two-component system OmpR family response regulator